MKLIRLVSCTALTLFLVLPAWAWGQTEINSAAELSAITSSGNYVITADIDASGFTTSIATFSGTLEANINPTTKMPYRITNLSTPLFTTLTGTVKNLVLEDVSISDHSGNTGAIACTANNKARIYNVGILSGSVGGSAYTGGLVGYIADSARVINCYSFADITGGTNVGGIVGYNNVATAAASIASGTMVMNCMFYGDITGGTTVSPIYGGRIINNLNSGGLNNFNYYAYDKLKTKAISTYNCALAVEEKYLKRIEFYRLLLNSNKVLAAHYATTSSVAVNPDDMLKWVLETADRQNTSPKPYPILKAQGKYPSIINIDAEHAEQLTLVNGRPSEADRNKGGKIGTLSVTISAPGGWSNAPSGAKLLDANGNEITTARTITLNRTDKDEGRFNFNYDKVQLPYYNDYGTKNYTGYKVVTGWKVTAITAVANDPYTSTHYPTTGVKDYPYHNYADRKSSNKDLYSVSGRVFSQGAYFDVPYGVTEITIEPYWGTAAYVSDEYLDVVCKYQKTTRNGSSNRHDYVPGNVTQLGKHFPTQKITIDGSEQTVHTSISSALSTLSGTKVYDNAVVLVGNMHFIGVISDGTKPFTMMSVDLDEDNEPDCSLIFGDNDRHSLSPLRFDFLNIPGAAQAQKPNGTGYLVNAAIFKTKGWFEITNTALMYFSQYEYENLTNNTKTDAPLILLGGHIDQFVSTQSSTVTGKTIYIHVGSNVLINAFGPGTHGDGSNGTPHVPVSVTGGDYLEFYLTGTYNPNAAIIDDNAECYISGGRFGELAGAAQEQIGNNNSASNGNVRWQIYEADIKNFYGGGCNDARPVQGNITTDIFNSHVTTFCGGPKFGNMSANKTVTTTAEGCTFGDFFGAGYGGNSYNRKKYYDKDGDQDWVTLQKYYYQPTSPGSHQNERGKFYNGTSTDCPSASYGKKGPGVATDFDYEFFVWTSGATGGRFYIKFASFSLATCNTVTSTLTNCTIERNFYGGGSLGKVSGTATSTLEDCTVKGNVFGAGYSATLPKIPVRNAGFAAKQGGGYMIPIFNANSGMFEKGILSDSTEYEWKNVASYPANNSSGLVGDSVVTTVDITKTNLGSVGTAILTLKGNTVVGTLDGNNNLVDGTGNVYGGGDQSTVNGTVPEGNTTVNLQQGVTVHGNVYGGGNRGAVSGNSSVIIQDPQP